MQSDVKPQPVNFGDLAIYVGRIRRLYDNLVHHGHREMEGVPRGAPLPFSFEEFEALVNAAIAVGTCHHCGGPLTESNCSPDHMRALSVGGKSELANIRIICKDCNNKKAHMLDFAFHHKMEPTRLENLRRRAKQRK